MPIDQGGFRSDVISTIPAAGKSAWPRLLKERRVTRVICSFPKTLNSTVFPELYREGFTELELVPQGTLAERIRAGGGGVPGVLHTDRCGHPFAGGKESASSMAGSIFSSMA